ncbi:MAG: sodium:proton antiporter NhaD [Bacteroidota bacterium]|jgi:Na+/H+ antiporter NhaD/arsenite permease-like protein
MYTLMIALFVLGYAAIAFEHSIKIDKAASALITGVVLWAVYVLSGANLHDAEHHLLEHVSEIASILFFLLGAMTIVEVVDAHQGFSVITDRIKTDKTVVLLWILGWLTFFLSAVLDNLTTSIVMVSLIRKLVKDQHLRWVFGGIIIIAANAGGAWSPIGDVTTTMLWIGGYVSTGNLISYIFLPSVAVLLAPLIYLSFTMKGTFERPETIEHHGHHAIVSTAEKTRALIVGVGGLLFVPVFKTVTHLPPFMGMMLSLGVLWVVTDLMHRRKIDSVRSELGILGVIRRIDTPSVLFFLGILLAVASLQTAGQLKDLATGLDSAFDTTTQTGVYLVGGIIGVLSAIVDNVPLVAAAMGMYDMVPGTYFAQDDFFWKFLAFTAGTGGSLLIIGSAAGVAVMGLEKIPFGWYLKKISALALIGYLAGIAVYAVQRWIIFG